nr:5-formyltetrahydrofolate cyclo-ligase [Oceanococcus sp. HetDA_MAG_MS8]
MCSKASYRRQLRALRRQLTTAQRQTEEQHLLTRLLRLLAHRRPRRIASYYPMGAEINPTIQAGQWREDGELYWPQIRHTGLRFAAANSKQLEQSSVGAWQPTNSARAAPLWSFSAVVMPLLACDRSGYRLGQGGGYYDRALARSAWHRPLLVGVGYDCQLVAKLPHEPHDQTLDLFLSASHALAFTPKGHRWLTGY